MYVGTVNNTFSYSSADVQPIPWKSILRLLCWGKTNFFLQKHDPSTTKKLCIVTLVKIFMLTQGHQSLVRELTTPSIPTFITSCLNIITLRQSSQDLHYPNINSHLLETVLQALIKLMPRHPSSFRPFVAQIKALIAPLLAPTPSYQPLEIEKGKLLGSFPGPTVALAQQLYALLPICAPKNSSNEEWGKATKDTIAQIHRTADYVFRAIIEDFPVSTRVPTILLGRQTYEDTVSDNLKEPIELPGWRGIEAGVERLVGLLQMLRSLIAVEGSSSYTLPVGAILSTIERIIAVTIPSSTSQERSGYQARLNLEIGRDEREGLWLGLPYIHVAATSVLSTLVTRLESSSIGFAQSVLEQLLWIFQHEMHDSEVRRSVYEAMVPILELIGPSMSRPTSMALSTLISEACNDVLQGDNRLEVTSKSATNGIKASSTSQRPLTNADSYLKQETLGIHRSTSVYANRKLATKLLTLVLSTIPTKHMDLQTRSLMDRTALLVKDEQAMLASVLNPQGPSKGKMSSSILPLFARISASSMELEGLLRPRMPILQLTEMDQGHNIDEDEDMNVTSADNTHQQTESERMTARNSILDLSAQMSTENAFREGAAVRPYEWRSDLITSAQPPKNLPESSKRGRAADDSEMAAEESTVGTESSEPKRVRLIEDVEHQQPEVVASTTLPSYPTTLSTSTTSLPQPGSTTVRLSTTYSEAGGANDSDDSFEIPPIIVDSDSDEELESESEE